MPYQPASLKILASNLSHVARLLRQDWDALFVIDGGERRGKTLLASHVIRVARPEIDHAIQCADYAPFLARSLYSWDDLCDWTEDSSVGDVVAYHEALLLGREAMTQFNLRAIRWISSIGHKNLLQVWTWTRFHRLDPVIRERCAVRGYIVQQGEGKRGLVRWYIRWETADPLPGYNEAVVHIPALEERYPSFDELGPLYAEAWAKLREKDNEAKRALRADAEGNRPEVKSVRALASKGFSEDEIAQTLGVPKRRVERWLYATE